MRILPKPTSNKDYGPKPDQKGALSAAKVMCGRLCEDLFLHTQSSGTQWHVCLFQAQLNRVYFVA